jgi:hypothetical protein
MEQTMTKVTYHIVQHDGGWAYKLGDVFSETFPTHDKALKRARIVALEQQVGGETAEISYQDKSGEWRNEHADGGDRPEADVEDTPS